MNTQFQLILLVVTSVFSLCPKEEYQPLNEMDNFTLMPLPYTYKDLEPVLWSQMAYFHHKKEHGKFIPALNDIVSSTSIYSSLTVTELLVQYGLEDNDLAISAGGYYSHSLFWWSIMPTQCANQSPEGQLLEDIEKYFGDFATFRDEFTRRAVSMFGSGWVWLCMNSDGHLVLNGKQGEYNPLGGEECIPLLGVDVWEHSYYLFYMDDREDWVERWWGIVDWELVEYWYQEYVSQSLPIPV